MFSLKKKLMAAVSMLVVSGMMLTTASFAWFTISTNPEISGLTTTVTVNENLELAVAKKSTSESYTYDTIDSADAQITYTGSSNVGNYYTYGNLVDFSYVSTLEAGDLGYDYTSFLMGAQAPGTTETSAQMEDNVVLAPMTFNYTTASEDGVIDGFSYPTYGYEGRVDEFALLTTEDSDGSFGLLKDANGNIYGYYIDFWMRSNVGGVVTLTTATDRADGNTEDLTSTESTDEDDLQIMGSGSTFTSENKELADNIGIAFEVITSGLNATYLVADTGVTAADKVVVATVAKDTVEGTGTADTDNDDDYVTTFTAPEGGIATLVQDEDTLIRMYVYLEGEDVTNLAASIDSSLETGVLNVQFGIVSATDTDDGVDDGVVSDNVDNAMNTPLPTATPST